MPAPARGYSTKLPEGKFDMFDQIARDILFLTPTEAAFVFMAMGQPMKNWSNIYWNNFHEKHLDIHNIGGAEIRKIRS